MRRSLMVLSAGLVALSGCSSTSERSTGSGPQPSVAQHPFFNNSPGFAVGADQGGAGTATTPTATPNQQPRQTAARAPYSVDDYLRDNAALMNGTYDPLTNSTPPSSSRSSGTALGVAAAAVLGGVAAAAVLSGGGGESGGGAGASGSTIERKPWQPPDTAADDAPAGSDVVGHGTFQPDWTGRVPAY